MLSDNSQNIIIIDLILWHYNTERVWSTTWEGMWIYNFSRVCFLSHFWLFAIPWMRAHQDPLSMEFSRQKYWSRVPFTIPGDLPDPGIKPESLESPALAGGFFFFFFLPLHHLGSPNFSRASEKRREFRESILYTTCIFIINVCLDQRNYP